MHVWARVYIQRWTIIFRFIFRGGLLYSDARKKARMSTSWRGNIFKSGLLYSGLYSEIYSGGGGQIWPEPNINSDLVVQKWLEKGGASYVKVPQKSDLGWRILGSRQIWVGWMSRFRRPDEVFADLGWLEVENSSPRRGFYTEGLLYSGLCDTCSTLYNCIYACKWHI